MSLSNDERKTVLCQFYEQEKNRVLEQKRMILKRFRLFVLNKLKENGQALEIRYCLINGKENVNYEEDLEMDQQFLLELISFKYSFQTELITDYKKEQFKVIKTTKKMEDLPEESTEKIFTVRKMKQRTTEAPQLEQQKIHERIQKRINNILNSIFKGKLSFKDLEFQNLVNLNFQTEQELQEIEKRIYELTTTKADHIFKEIEFEEEPKVM